MDKLQSALKQSVSKSLAVIKSMPWDDRHFYGNYLAQTFYYVRHSTRMLATSAGRLSYEEQQSMHLRFLKHLGEEAGHEKLAINDLKALGFSLDDFKELDATRFFYEPQYFKIEHKNPLAIMGYILFLECIAQEACPMLAQRATKNFGKKTASFLQVHGDEDPHHVEEANKLIASLPPAALDVITENLLQSATAFDLVMNEMAEMAKNMKNKKAA